VEASFAPQPCLGDLNKITRFHGSLTPIPGLNRLSPSAFPALFGLIPHLFGTRLDIRAVTHYSAPRLIANRDAINSFFNLFTPDQRNDFNCEHYHAIWRQAVV
jgi:hypothetical protein